MSLGVIAAGGITLYSFIKTVGHRLSHKEQDTPVKKDLRILIPGKADPIALETPVLSPSTGSPVPETPITGSPTSPTNPLSGRVELLDAPLEHGKKLLPLLTDIIPNDKIEKEPKSVSEKRAAVEKIRKEEGSRPDRHLDEILHLEKAITEAIKKSPKDMAEFLNVQGFKRVLDHDGMAVWESPRGQYRFITDNNSFKFKLFQDRIKTLAPGHILTYKDLNPDSNKVCTSVVTDKHPTYLAGQGIIVYLGPKSRPYSVQICDALSITEDWNKNNPTFSLSRTYTKGYCLDQVIYSVGYDWVDKVRQGYIKELQTLKSTKGLGRAECEKIDGALELLQQKPTSIMKKDLLTTEEPKTELESQIEQLINIGKEFPIFTQTKIHSFLQTTQKTVSVYSKNKDVMARSVVKQQVSGWEVSVNELTTTHPLVGLRSQLASIQKDYAELCQSTDLDPQTLKLLPENVSQFLSNHREHFDRNVGTSATPYLTVTESIEENAKQKKEMIEKLKEVQEHIKKDFKGNPKAEEIHKNCQKSIDEISKMYNEIQFYTADHEDNSDELTITGFGVNPEYAKQAMADNYPELLQNYNKNKTDLDTAKKRLEDLNTIAGQTSDPADKAKLDKDIEKCKAEITTLGKAISGFEGVKLNREAIELGKKLNVPCFMHYGPEQR